MVYSARTLWRWLPEELRRTLDEYAGRRTRFSGNYGTWPEAVGDAAGGYASEAIFERVRTATEEARRSLGLKVERDGFLLDAADSYTPLPEILSRIASKYPKEFHVVDFGGSLGSTFFQNCERLSGLCRLRWTIVEQPHFVRHGQAHLENDVLGFKHSLQDAVVHRGADMVLFSGVLQYLESPPNVAEQAISLKPSVIVIDRTPIIDYEVNKIALQRVPRGLGKACYPTWLFNQDELLKPYLIDYQVQYEFPAIDGVMNYRRRKVHFKGFVLEKKPGSALHVER